MGRSEGALAWKSLVPQAGVILPGAPIGESGNGCTYVLPQDFNFGLLLLPTSRHWGSKVLGLVSPHYTRQEAGRESVSK